MQRKWQLRWQQGHFSIADMDTNPFRDLDAEWATIGSSTAARRALRRWADSEPCLRRFHAPADVVAACQRRGDPAAANTVLGALLRLAADPLAARAVLQAVLPALAARAWRRRHDAAAAGPWDSIADLDVEVIAFAIERIAELAGTSPSWPAQAVVEVAWSRLRWSATRARRRRIDTVALGPTHDRAAPGEADVADQLRRVLVGAVGAGRLRRPDAALIYATRVLGHTPAEVAAAARRDVRAVRIQRARAERRLAAAG